ncbi:transcriptional regulator with XRE-family HTH domain [Brevundimonas sp. SORGH_AS 993]|nr:transcriptional regulator with XRE-family HTH domain [Brevundimonas sp. SORGH_AS_0993]
MRRERGLSQAEAGARLDMTSQGWGLYESGRRPGLFRPDVQRRLTAALDSTPEILALTAARIAPPPAERTPQGVESKGRGFDGASASSEIPSLRLTDDHLAPWAGAGVIVDYRPGQAPRPGQGCVVETTDGDLMIRLFDGDQTDGVRLRGAGALDRREILPHGRIVRMSAIIARRDE